MRRREELLKALVTGKVAVRLVFLFASYEWVEGFHCTHTLGIFAH